MKFWVVIRCWILAGLATGWGLSFAVGQELETTAGAARERRRVQRLEQAKGLINPADPFVKPDFTQGLRLLQSLLDDGNQAGDEPGADDVFLNEPNDAVEPAENKSPRIPTLKSEARRLLRSLSSDGRQTYETLFGAMARAELEAALASRAWGTIEDVGRRWPYTKAGDDAVALLAARAFDAGDSASAARRWGELWESPGSRVARDPELSLRFALSLRLAGDRSRCRDVLVELQRTMGDRRIAARASGEQLAWPAKSDELLSWLDRWAGLSASPLTLARGTAASDWPVTFGNASRSGIGSAAVPTESPVWRRSLLGELPPAESTDSDVPTSESELKESAGAASPTTIHGAWGAVRFEARSRVEQARQADQPVLPAGSAIAVGDVVVSRTLSQVRAWRLSNGEPLWHSSVVDPVLSELLGRRRRGRTDRSERQELEAWVNQRLWEDRGQATLSSDGEFVFSLHDRTSNLSGPPVAWRGLMVPQEFNTLAATELSTGRLAWEIGGTRGDRELPTAGLFFLGPPLPWRDRLFVLAEDGPWIWLIVLNARDGRMLWTQTLAVSDPQWFGARHDAALSPTVVGELVICPTGAGSVVAIDPVRRELVWHVDYRDARSRPVPTRRFDFHASPVESFWSQSEILSAGDRLFVAAPDHSELLCLNAADGRVIWTRAHANGLFLAGATASEVLIVGRTELQALRTENGDESWAQAVPPPSGRGVLIEGVLHQPNIRGEVVSFDTKSGQVLATTKVSARPENGFIGNLLVVESRIVSQSADVLMVFPRLGDMRREFSELLTTNPDDASALERRGRMSLHLGDRAGGLNDLRRSVALRPTASAKRQLVDLLFAELTSGSNDSKSEELIRELEPLVSDPEQRLRFAKLRAEHWSHRRQWLSAAREYLKLADAWQPGESVDVSDGPHFARQDRWIAGRLAELSKSMSAEDRSQLNAELQARLKTAIGSDGPGALRAFLVLFGWSDSAVTARTELITRLDPKKHRHTLEATLFDLRRRGTPDEQAMATAHLARHWQALGEVERSRPLIHDLMTRFATTIVLEGKTGREFVEPEVLGQLHIGWPNQPGKLKPADDVSAVVSRATVVGWSAAPDVFHEGWRLEFDPTARALVARDGANRIRWQARQPFDDEIVPAQVGRSAQVRGRYAVVNLGNRFVVLDTIPAANARDATTRLLWQQVLFDPRIDPDLTPATGRAPSVIRGAPDRYQLVDSSGRRLGRPAIINDELVAYQTGSRLVAAELPTGETLWSFDGLPHGCELTGDAEGVVATAPDSGEAFVFDSIDGRLLAQRPNLSGLWLATVGRNRLTWSAGAHACELLLTDVVTNQVVRRERLEADAWPCLSLLDTVAVFEQSGRWRLWRIDDGTELLDAKVPPIANISHIVALRDRERWMLMTHVEEAADAGQARARVEPLHFTHWRVNGPAFAFDRATGKPLWTTTIAWQGLNASQPMDSPLFVFSGHATLPRPGPEGQPRILDSKHRLLVLDRRTGKSLELPDIFRPFNHVEQRPNLDSKSVELLIDELVQKNNSVQIERRQQQVVFEP